MSYKCLKCNKEFKAMNPLGRHLLKIHNSNLKEYYDEFIKNPDEGICLECGLPTKFDNIKNGYRRFCSAKCAASSSKTKNKRENTNIQKYGVKAVSQLPEIIEKIKTTWENKDEQERQSILDKTISTNLEKYGVSCTFQDKDVKEKIEQTNLKKYGVKNIFENRDYMVQKYNEKYGVDNPGQITWVKEKIANTNLVRHGDTYIFNDPIIRDKANKTKRANAINNIKNVLSINNTHCTVTDTEDILQHNGKYLITYKLHCDKCNNNFNATYQQIIYYKDLLCPICNNHNTVKSKQELEVLNYLNTLTSMPIKHSIRTILNGKELDLYIPDKKLAIEYDGLYWHSELYVDPDYHLWKTEECEKQGIQLIHIFEDEWIYKQNIVKSRLKDLFGMNDRIYARKCEIKEVSYNESEKFLNENHMQGNCMSKYRYGLYNNDQLVSIMTFGQSRFKKDEFELIRFCNKLNMTVVGGASKLFKYFINNHPEIKTIVSFADRRWSIGKLYKKLNFFLTGVTKPTYYYIINDIRHNRLVFQKHKLITDGADSTLSEHEIMLQNKIYRIYDCGNLKFKWIRK